MRIKARHRGPKPWRKWFAWYPVKVFGTWVWLEFVNKWGGMEYDPQYEILPKY